MPTRQKVFQAEGLVTAKYDRGERDMVFSLLTADRGRILVLAKYAKKVPSRHNAGLELFNVVRCQLYEGRFLPVVTQSQQTRCFPGLLSSVRSIESAYKLCLLLNAVLQPGQGDTRTYERVLQALEAMQHGGVAAQLALLDAAVALLCELGHLRWGDNCQQCDRDLQIAHVFCQEGRLLCGSCARHGQSEPVSPDLHALITGLIGPDGIRMPEKSLLDAGLTFIHRQITGLTSPAYLEKVSFTLSRQQA